MHVEHHDSPSLMRPTIVESVSALVERQGRRIPESIAFRFEGRDTSYAKLAETVARTANALAAEGVGKGSRICYVGKNSDVFFFLLYAAARIGAVMVPIGWRLAQPEIRYIVNDTEGMLLFSDAELLPKVRAMRGELGTVRKIIATETGDGEVDFFAWIAGATATADHAPDDSDRAFLQLYTSGTTGHPKGVMLSARNFFGMRLRCQAAGVDWDRWSNDDVALIAMPISHVGGAGYGLMALFHGALGLVVREFSPESVLDLIERENVSKFFIVPAALQIVVNHPRARMIDYGRIRHILYGASPMPLPLLREALDVFGAGLVQQYGMTETAGTVVALGVEDHDPAGNLRMKSAGRALPGVEIRIVDSDNRPLPAGQTGEIVTRSDANMLGYWKRPEETAKTIDQEGWLHTGDAGYLDDDGYLFICDRLKDMVLSGGENIYPAEVEAVLYEHPQVAEVAVIGVPDDKWGEVAKAVVVPRPMQTIDPDELINWARGRLAGYKLPKSVDIVEALPRNASGKILKRELRAPYWAAQERQVH